MSIMHLIENGAMRSKRFRHDSKPPAIDTATIRKDVRESKERGNSKLPIHHVTLEKLLDAFDALNGATDDWRRTIGG